MWNLNYSLNFRKSNLRIIICAMNNMILNEKWRRILFFITYYTESFNLTIFIIIPKIINKLQKFIKFINILLFFNLIGRNKIFNIFILKFLILSHGYSLWEINVSIEINGNNIKFTFLILEIRFLKIYFVNGVFFAIENILWSSMLKMMLIIFSFHESNLIQVYIILNRNNMLKCWYLILKSSEWNFDMFNRIMRI